MSNGFGAMVGVIPLVFTGGVLMKMTDSMMPHGKRGQSVRRQPRRRPRQQTRRSRSSGFGDFSNVGF